MADTPTDRSGTITAGGADQQLMPARLGRRGYWVQNNSSGDLWVNALGTAAASQPSMKIGAGALYETPAHMVPPGEVRIFGATTGQTFTAREW